MALYAKRNQGLAQRARTATNRGMIMDRFKKPTSEQVNNYCSERNNGIDAEAFIDHYESKGWKIGKTPMKDWQAAVRTWERKNREKNIKLDTRASRTSDKLDKIAKLDIEKNGHSSALD